MSTEQESGPKKVVYSLGCIERCNILPALRRLPEGAIEAYVPICDNPDVVAGEWVAVQVQEVDDFITLSCEPTREGFRPVYICTKQQFEQALQAGTVSPVRISGRCCGPCSDRGKRTSFEIRTTERGFFVDTKQQSYQFALDSTYGKEHVTPHMVTLVVEHLKRNGRSEYQELSFFDVLKQAIEESTEKKLW